MTVATLVGAGSKVNSAGSSVSSIDVPLPGGVAEGDVVILSGATFGAGSWDIAPAWTPGYRQRIPTPSGMLASQVWTHTLGPSPDDHVHVPFTANVVVGTMVAAVYRDVTSLVVQGTTNLAAPAVSAPGDSVSVYVWLAYMRTGTTALTPPTEVSTVVVAAPAVTMPMLVAQNSVSGAFTRTQTANRSNSNSSRSLMGVTIALSANRPPNAPTLLTPPNASTLGRAELNRFAWGYSDPDVGSSQSAYDLRYSADSGATWTTVSAATPSTYLDIPGGTFTADDYEWQVRTYDEFGIVGPWSASSFFTAADPIDAPTITYPTAGGTVSQADRVDWSYPDQDGYQVRRVADAAGAPDTGTIYFDSGEDDTATTRTYALDFPTNDQYEHIQVRVIFGGIWSDWVDVRVLVSYTPPPVADLQVGVTDDGGGHALAYMVPAAGEGVPTATSLDILVSVDGGVTSWLPDNLAGLGAAADLDGAATYWLPASGVEHCYQAVTHADNGTTAATEWVVAGRLTVDEVV